LSWLEKILFRIIDGQGRPSDVDLLLDVSDNITPGITWPPRQTTICPLGPSAVSPIASAVMRFKHEFEAYIGAPVHTTVKINGAAYNSKATANV
jgi:NADH-quinone oxidoreductase subunit F